MEFSFMTVVCRRQWSCNFDSTFNGDMTLPESFDDSSKKPKKMNAAKKHKERQRLLLNTP